MSLARVSRGFTADCGRGAAWPAFQSRTTKETELNNSTPCKTFLDAHASLYTIRRLGVVCIMFVLMLV